MAENRDEKVLSTVVKTTILAILLIAFYFAFFVRSPLGIDVENLYQAVHPFRLEDFFGLIGLLFYGLVIAGFIRPIQGWIQPRSENSIGLSWVVFAVAAVLIIIMMAD